MKNQTSITDKATLPLDAFVEIIRKRFPKYISPDDTKCNIFRKKDCVLFRKEHHNEYCLLKYTRGCDSYSITLFKSDWKDWERIEGDFLNNSFSFAVFKNDLQVIMDCIA